MGSLKRSGNLKMATLTHSIRRSDTITAIVEKVRTRSGQGGSFGKFLFLNGQNQLQLRPTNCGPANSEFGCTFCAQLAGHSCNRRVFQNLQEDRIFSGGVFHRPYYHSSSSFIHDDVHWVGNSNHFQPFWKHCKYTHHNWYTFILDRLTNVKDCHVFDYFSLYDVIILSMTSD